MTDRKTCDKQNRARRHTCGQMLHTLIMIALMMAVGGGDVWGQDLSGVYYIASGGKGEANGDTYTYNAGTPANNFYLCPTEGWCYYKPDNDFSNDGTIYPNPFLTTYKCRDGVYEKTKAVWIVRKHPSEDYYYIIQALTGRYLLSNGVIRTTSGGQDRIRVHLEDVDEGDLDDKALFTIDPDNGSYRISPKDLTDGAYYTSHSDHAKHTWLTVNNGNYNYLVGRSGKTGGPNENGIDYTNTAGTVGIYTKTDANTPFYFEKATVDPPTITNNFDGTFTITSETGANIYYTTDGTTPTTSTPTTGTTSVNVSQTESMTVIKAIAKGSSDDFPSLETTYNIPKCERPVITVSSGMVTITCSTPGVAIHYTTDGTPATSLSATYSAPFAKGSITTIRAIATLSGYINSNEARLQPPAEVSTSSEISDMYGNYILASNFSLTSSIGTSDNPFMGTIDGNMVTRTFSYPLVAYAVDATIKNVILDNVSISGGTNVGAICNEASGDSRIYNCGVLATNSTVTTDEDGYTVITSCSSTISGSGYVGGIVGLLDGEARVINCFSYAEITGGDKVGGIVGYNNVATTSSNLKTMVMNCMFYGNITGGSDKAPIYNGQIISNKEDTGVGNYNYFLADATFTGGIDTYNCALMAEKRFLQRFEFYRHLLNSHRELAGWWATGTFSKTEIAKWVLEPTQLGTSTPYPILKVQGKYPSVVNYDAENATLASERNKGGKLGTLSVTIEMGNGEQFNHPGTGESEAKITTSSLTLNILDKDPDHFNFNYYKVQLPYYNDVGTKNYTGNRVVTGWKITSITGGTAGTFTSSGADATATVNAETGEVTLTTPYNFADRNCTNKDLYGTGGSKRVFAQGAYFDVPEGVTAITIQPYWAKCVYLADANADVVYDQSMSTTKLVANVGGGAIYVNEDSYAIGGESKTVYTSIKDAVTALAPNTSHTVNDYAVVLVGNYHQISNEVAVEGSKPYTVTTIDLDGDNEPDYSYMLRFNARVSFHPVKYDFLNLVGLGMAQKSTGSKGSYNFGILRPIDWFEVTNTALFRVTQMESDPKGRKAKPLILHGGVIEQWVSGQSSDPGNHTTYIHVGSNVWFKEFHIGCHQDDKLASLHPPVSVTGGDYDEFYLTGLYADAPNYNDNAECYINGGRFGMLAGTAMDGIGNDTSHDNGNIVWQIQNADIEEFYGGGINAAKPIEGSITTVITDSHVKQFCGGPQFGDMDSNETVITIASDCTFGTFFGAGYGGNSYYRAAPGNFTDATDPWDRYNVNWNEWITGAIKGKRVNSGDYANNDVYSGYDQTYNSNFGGVSTRFDYQFLPQSDNEHNVARLFIDFVKFSLATTHNVTSTLTGCTITGNFYGGGSLGKVDGNVTSTLTDCTVRGSAFGGGYDATRPTVQVMSTSGFTTPPSYDTNTGVFIPAAEPYNSSIEYKWAYRASVTDTETAIDKTNHILYTTEDLTVLGAVDGDVTLTLDGSTTVEGDVYGAGDASAVTGAAHTVTVNLKGNTTVNGDVFGGGNNGKVKGSAKVNIMVAE